MKLHLSCRTLIFALLVAASVRADDETPALRAPPTPEQQTHAEKQLRDLYPAEFAQKAPGVRRAFAQKLFAAADESRDDSTGQFVLLKNAAEIAASAGDSDDALHALDRLGRVYSIDTFQMKVSALKSAARVTENGKPSADLAGYALALCNDAIARDEYEQGETLAAIAQSAASRSNVPDLTAEARLREKEIRLLQGEFAKAKSALVALRTNPGDPAANESLGQFYCLAKGDWIRGLPFLARGNKPELKTVSAKDLAGPDTPVKQFELAGDWWAVSQQSRGTERTRLEERAAYWYQSALPQLSGLNKSLAEQRLKESEESEAASDTAKLRLSPSQLNAAETRAKQLAQKLGFPPPSRLRAPDSMSDVAIDDGAIDLQSVKSRVVWKSAVPDSGTLAFYILAPREIQGRGLLFSNARSAGGNPSFEVWLINDRLVHLDICDGDWRECIAARPVRTGGWSEVVLAWGRKGMFVSVDGDVTRVDREASPDGSDPSGLFGVGRVYAPVEAVAVHVKLRLLGADVSKKGN